MSYIKKLKDRFNRDNNGFAFLVSEKDYLKNKEDIDNYEWYGSGPELLEKEIRPIRPREVCLFIRDIKDFQGCKWLLELFITKRNFKLAIIAVYKNKIDVPGVFIQNASNGSDFFK